MDEKTQFITPSTSAAPAPAAKLVRIDSSVADTSTAQIMLAEREITIGSDARNHAVLKDDGVSKSHVRVFPGSGTWGLEDLGSKNGVIVNHDRVTRTWLKPNDVIKIGTAKYRYRLADGDEEEDRTILLGAGPARSTRRPSGGSGSPSSPSDPGEQSERVARLSTGVIVAIVVVVLVMLAALAWLLV